jgi:serine/threonine-protein kinase
MASDANSRFTSGPVPVPRSVPQPLPPAASASRASGTGGIAVAASASQFGGQTPGGARDGAPSWQGKRLGRFKLVAEIGRGAMGRVFRAEDEVLARFVALKVVPTKTRDGSRSRQLERFIHEARAAAGLEHPNIVTVYDVGEHKDVYAIAMELVEGGDLETLVRAGAPLDVARACLLTAEAAEGLAHAHALNVLHRDVKPSNLMLSRNGRCKVCDFGLARVLDANDACDLNDINKSVGTPLYTAPEVIRGQGASARSDVYSLGATLYFLLTGRPPFLAPTKAGIIKLHLTEPPPDVRDLRPDVPVTLADVIERCLAKEPEDRFQDAAALAKVLRVHTIAVDAGSASASGMRSRGSATPPGGRAAGLGRWWPLYAGSGLAAAILIGLGVFAATRGPDEPPTQTTAAAAAPVAAGAPKPAAVATTSTPPPPPAPAAPPPREPAPTPKPVAVAADPTVHVTKSGKKYHAAGCRSLENSDIEIALSEAKAKGYAACSTCSPPE